MEGVTTMAVDNIPFRNRAKCLVVLVALKDHPRRIYLYSKTGGEEYSWAMRDYLTGKRVRSGDSTLTASQVEELIDHAEQPPACPVERIDFWSSYCTEASERHFGTGNVDVTMPNPPTLGDWKGIDGKRTVPL
jgi:hypothetical protein